MQISTFSPNSRMWVLVLLAAITPITLAQTSQPAARTGPPKVGDAAPELSLETLDGKKVVLAELRKNGPVVVVELRGWVGYQCPICTQQVGDLVRNAADIKATGASVVLVYPGAGDKLKEHATEFIAGKGLPEGFHFVLDPDMKFVTSWGLRWNAPNETAYPSSFVVDKEGVIRFAKTSTTHGNRASAADIIAALKALKP